MTPVAFRISAVPLFNVIRLRQLVRPEAQGLLLAAMLMLLAGAAQAAGSSMPWEGPLQSILESIQGPLIQIVFGLSIAFAASSFFLSFFSFSGGALV